MPMKHCRDAVIGAATLITSLSQQQALGKVSTRYQPPEIRSPLPACTTLRFGLIADLQYADAPPDRENNRYYRHSLRKLSAATVELQNGEITIHGYGIEISRVLPVIGTD